MVKERGQLDGANSRLSQDLDLLQYIPQRHGEIENEDSGRSDARVSAGDECHGTSARHSSTFSIRGQSEMNSDENPWSFHFLH